MSRSASCYAAENGKASRDERLIYASVVRHLIAFCYALKQRYRQKFDVQEYLPVLLISEWEDLVGAQTPHLVLLSALAMMLRPIKARDTGSGQYLVIWSELHAGVAKLQSIACCLDLVARPLPASYSLLTARFLFVWVATLPIVLLDLMHASCVPLVMLCVSWALYSTEELATLMEAPFGGVSSRGEKIPETLPLDLYCDTIVSELKQQLVINRAIDRRVEGGRWVVKPSDLAGGGSDLDVDASGVDE
eukprot:CAMPEP_0119341838 /NCGR_PEP_ID=MMETSP1333-20130426/103389_1 /TAXON_ID=418940 /ORGANISM="Scyphosphaera apsteinii, Strain RCC1455" /LENGTH=247 /DNA_ID=CAMNT_0007353923 /DNA_START=538 /DNA_END=1281 /DNA_ORIENTATION=-